MLLEMGTKERENFQKLIDNACAVISLYDADEIPDPCIIQDLRDALAGLGIDVYDDEECEEGTD